MSKIIEIGGAAGLLTLVGFLIKKWFSVRLEQSVGLESAKELEKYKATLQKDQSHAEEIRLADIKLFEELRTLLPSNAVIAFLREHDFGGSFHSSQIASLHVFEDEWAGPERHFRDAEVERKRSALYGANSEFLAAVAKYCYSDDGGGGRLSVTFGMEKDHVKLAPQIEALNSRADKLAVLHEELIEEARRKLKC